MQSIIQLLTFFSAINSSSTAPRRQRTTRWLNWPALTAMLVLLGSTGCTSLLTPIEGIPVSRLPPELLGIRRSDYVPVPVVMLSIPAGQEYRLDEGDILGVYIQGVLPFSSPTSVPEPPPVNFPDSASALPPSIGYPIPVQANGLISLPLLDPISVKGLTMEEVRVKIKRIYEAQEFVQEGKANPIVTLIRERTYNVTVLRENAVPAGKEVDQAARGVSLKLPAYQNDLLHALTQSGGMPGVNEKNEVTIFKTSRIPAHMRDEVMSQLMAGSGEYPCLETMISDCQASAGLTFHGLTSEPYMIKVPLRMPPGQTMSIRPEDIELINGDIVLVESRESELFYTGGLLPGGQHAVPRDYDLDVLGAMAIAGSGVDQSRGGSGGGAGGGIIGGLGGAKPTQLFIVRKLPSGRTYNIAVDLQLAVNNSSENILVQPGDTLILRNKPHEELLNFGIATFFTYGIRELFSN
ncbi:Polysaccharide biosynthesis/export protein [Novipirellula aureliae]|uniref:Polysaccharide biosynthesis/export protein n=1 Tax=Novipirellula aureliae TaxID=2527966 RepID=A0A5C6E698_9BACT|nr:polysaccharide biosynthesis/export family protein [Novipirellula aureliae]TWU44358.1 Polysaccharide biosynthesis/export protein [Novipirellula aureliae]